MSACPGSSVHLKLKEFRREAKYSDVCILVNGEKFKCHRVILAAASSYFDSMFCGNFKESCVENLRLNDIDPELFGEVLQHMYSGELTITEVNVFNLLRISDFLSVRTIQEPCVDFILNNMHSIENVIKMFVWARTMNFSSLIEPLLEYISWNFIDLSNSERTAFLEMEFDDLFTVLTRRSTKDFLFGYRQQDVLVDALVQWLHFSFIKRRDDFEKLEAKVPYAQVSFEYLRFLEQKYKLNSQILYTGSLKNYSFFKRFIQSCEGCSHHESFPASFADHKFSNHSSIHLYLGKKIFSINRYKPNGFVSYSNDSGIRSPDINTLLAFSECESNYLYCLRNCGNDSQSFCAYSSIDLLPRDDKYLRPPPVHVRLEGALDFRNNTCKGIYFALWLDHSGIQRRNKMYSTNYRSFSDEEISGVFHYNCEIDDWFSVPQMRGKFSVIARPAINNGLVYFICEYGRFRAYDTRSAKCINLPRIMNYCNNYHDCCTLNGNIYVSNGETIDSFDHAATKWSIPVDSSDKIKNQKHYLVPYEDMLWLFYHDLSIRVYNLDWAKSCVPHDTLCAESILAKCNAEG